MGNENGTWIMYGVEWDDPECLHTVQDAINYINEVGFLPLFKNDIKKEAGLVSKRYENS